MIRTVTAETAYADGEILNEMFRARGRVFGTLPGWNVELDDAGREVDRFDALRPTYLVDMDDARRHRGSLRLLPTTGETLLHGRFADIMDGTALRSAGIWECTRFCIDGPAANAASSDAARRIVARLLLGLNEVCSARGIQYVLTCFEGRMGEMYRCSGWMPELLGRSGRGDAAVFLGAWVAGESSVAALREASGIAGSILETPPSAPIRMP